MVILPKSKIRPVQARDWWQTGWRIGVLIMGEIVGVMLATHYLPEQIAIPIWLIFVSILVWWLIRFHANHFCFQCSKCHQFLKVSTLENLCSLHGFDRNGSWYLFHCIQCHAWHRCRIYRTTSG